MKKIITSIAATLVLTSALFAQMSYSSMERLRKNAKEIPANFSKTPHNTNNTTQGFNQLEIYYPYSDSVLWANTISGPERGGYYWPSNMRYSLAAGDTSLKEVVATVDSLYDINTNTSVLNSTITQIRVDSIFFQYFYSNNSSMDDTLVVELISLTAAGYPSTTVYHRDTLTYLNGDLLVGGGWGMISPNYTGTMKKFGIRFKYYDPSKTDTFGLVAEFIYDPADLGCGTSSTAEKARPTNFRKNQANSYAYWMEYAMMVPTSSGGDLYYDCDNSGTYTPGGADGDNYIQNWRVYSYITTDPILSTEELNSKVKVYQNTPNPFGKSTTINYELAENSTVTLNVFDITGKEVLTVNEGNKNKGKHALKVDASLSNGIYYYTLNANGTKSVMKKMIITN